jgi:predicted regulator of Ras-like GTPase activity (Roadblock/LC7/MglB family)
MDERDFAELISVFLKGSDTNNEIASTDTDEQSTDAPNTNADEAEIRKNIIEALAEKIRESKDKTALPEKDVVERIQDAGQAIAGNVKNNVNDNGKKETSILTEEKIALQTIVESPSDSLDKTSSDKIEDEVILPDTTPQKISSLNNADIETVSSLAAEDLVTEEEAETLLIGNEYIDEPGIDVPLQHILQRFLELDGVNAALLVSRDGFTVEHASKMELDDLDTISAIIATGFSLLDKIGDELKQNALQIAMLEYLNGPIIVTPLVHDIVLVIVASQWATLGRIRLEIKRQSSELIVNL